MATVSQVLDRKGTQVWTISADADVLAALRMMAEANVGALVVTDHGRPAGILSERDYARKVALLGRRAVDTGVSDIMSRQIYAVRPDTLIDECMAIMNHTRNRHLPVIEDGKLKGIVSIGDVVKQLLHEKDCAIEQLEQYIASA